MIPIKACPPVANYFYQVQKILCEFDIRQLFFMTHLYIRNMCCSRCIRIVEAMFSQTKYKPSSVKVGEMVMHKKISEEDVQNIEAILNTENFSITTRHADKMVVRIHALLCQYVRENMNKDANSTTLSIFLEKQLHRSYFHLSKLFSSEAGITIERYFLLLKMERAKELLIEGVETISSIAYELGYSTSQIFSTQFKKETGKTPTQYRLNPVPHRTHWDEILPQHFKQNK